MFKSRYYRTLLIHYRALSSHAVTILKHTIQTRVTLLACYSTLRLRWRSSSTVRIMCLPYDYSEIAERNNLCEVFLTCTASPYPACHNWSSCDAIIITVLQLTVAAELFRSGQLCVYRTPTSLLVQSTVKLTLCHGSHLVHRIQYKSC